MAAVNKVNGNSAPGVAPCNNGLAFLDGMRGLQALEDPLSGDAPLDIPRSAREN